MPNEIRPCQPDGWNLKKPFDACKVEQISYGMQTVRICLPNGIISYQAETGKHLSGGNQIKVYRDTLLAIAEALNAPVLATEEVLAGLSDLVDKGEFWTKHEDRKHRLGMARDGEGEYFLTYWTFEIEGDEPCDKSWERIVPNTIYIEPSNQIAREYLLNFYTNGVRIKEGG